MASNPTRMETNCPHCGVEIDAAQPAPGENPDAVLKGGSVTMCLNCAETGIFDDDLTLRKPTEEELAEFEQDDHYLRLRDLTRQKVLERHTHVAMVELDTDGSITVNGHEMPEGIRELVGRLIENLQFQAMAETIRKTVTQEVANHVLAYYGNEQASYPSVSITALISLIKLCDEMDTELMHELAESERIRGYVMAVSLLAEEGAEGIEMLEKIAGLRDWPKKEE